MKLSKINLSRNKKYFLFIVVWCFIVILVENYFECFAMDGNTKTKANKFQKVDMFIKQLALAQRYERQNALRESITTLVEQVLNVNSVATAATKQDINLNDVTLLLNAVQEIKDINEVLKEIMFKSNIKWIKDIRITVGLTSFTFEKHETLLNGIKKSFPKFTWVIVPTSSTKTLNYTLRYLLERTTKTIVVTRSFRRLNRDFDMIEFLRPLYQRKCDVIGGSSMFVDGTWHLGCYQSKLIWSQYKVQSGFDTRYAKNLVRCDTIDGPFAARKNFLLKYLQRNSYLDRVLSYFKNEKISSLVYTQLMYNINNDKRVMLVHPESIFHTSDTRDWLKATRNQWKDFVIRNGIGEIVSETVEGNFSHYKFTYTEAESRCKYGNNMLQPRPCMLDLHDILINSYKIFDKYGFRYTNEDGSAMAATKLGTSLPWDLDQDFAFQTSNFSELVKHEAEFNKIGITLKKQIDKPCVKGLADLKANDWTCGYVGFHDDIWRVEGWGQYLLISDYYQPERIPEVFRNQLPWFWRTRGNATLVKMGEYWTVTRPNPGYYARGRYGSDFLKHAKHWSLVNSPKKHSMNNYETSPRFFACPEEGHHLCMNQYLADGNIQFQRVWA